MVQNRNNEKRRQLIKKKILSQYLTQYSKNEWMNGQHWFMWNTPKEDATYSNKLLFFSSFYVYLLDIHKKSVSSARLIREREKEKKGRKRKKNLQFSFLFSFLPQLFILVFNFIFQYNMPLNFFLVFYPLWKIRIQLIHLFLPNSYTVCDFINILCLYYHD